MNREKYGAVDILRTRMLKESEKQLALAENRQVRRLQVLVDGEDVTRRCVFADDTKGVAKCYCVNPAGRYQILKVGGNYELAKEWLTGKVTIGFCSDVHFDK